MVLLVLFINQLVPFINDAAYNENKKKAELPVLNINKLDPLPAKFENYIRDNFSLRGIFLNKMGNINTNFWKKSPKPDKLIIGQNKWLYSVDKELDYYLGKSGYSVRQMRAFVKEFERRKQILNRMGIKMLIVVHPNKYSIYPEYLPSFLQYHPQKSASQKLLDYVAANSDLHMVYLKNALLAHKNQYQLFLKSDNHWNEIGGYFAAKKVVNSLHFLADIDTISISEFCADSVVNFKGNLANMAANASLFAETKPLLKRCNEKAKKCKRFAYQSPKGFPYPWEYQKSYCTEDTTLPNALIIRDSFGSALIPYMKNCFNYSTFIFDAWQYNLNLEIVKKEKPDVVIFMMLENLIPGNFE